MWAEAQIVFLTSELVLAGQTPAWADMAVTDEGLYSVQDQIYHQILGFRILVRWELYY